VYEYVKEVPSAKVGCWVVRVFRQNEAMLVVVEVYFLREILKETTREIQDTELHNTTTQNTTTSLCQTNGVSKQLVYTIRSRREESRHRVSVKSTKERTNSS